LDEENLSYLKMRENGAGPPSGTPFTETIPASIHEAAGLVRITRRARKRFMAEAAKPVAYLIPRCCLAGDRRR
jgi:hypothetical protein